MSIIEVVVDKLTCIYIIPEFLSGGEKLSNVLYLGKLVNISSSRTAVGLGEDACSLVLPDALGEIS